MNSTILQPIVHFNELLVFFFFFKFRVLSRILGFWASGYQSRPQGVFLTRKLQYGREIIIAVTRLSLFSPSWPDKRQELRYLRVHFVLRPSDHSFGVTLSGKPVTPTLCLEYQSQKNFEQLDVMSVVVEGYDGGHCHFLIPNFFFFWASFDSERSNCSPQ